MSFDVVYEIGCCRLPVVCQCPGFGSDDDGYTLDECVSIASPRARLTLTCDRDCLTLNVIRAEGILAGRNLPVGWFFYGGSYAEGGSGDVRYNGTWIVERSVAMGKPIVRHLLKNLILYGKAHACRNQIFVSINYRVGAGGFLYSGQVAAEGSQNLGVRDQVSSKYHRQQESVRITDLLVPPANGARMGARKHPLFRW